MNTIKRAMDRRMWNARRGIQYPSQYRFITAMVSDNDTPEPYRAMSTFWMLHNRRQRSMWWRG